MGLQFKTVSDPEIERGPETDPVLRTGIDADRFALVLLHRLQGGLQHLARDIVVARKCSLDPRANLLCEIDGFAIVGRLQRAPVLPCTGIFIDIAITGLPSSSSTAHLAIR
jgi:hypothetical protein